jgi:hypothetical protein
MCYQAIRSGQSLILSPIPAAQMIRAIHEITLLGVTQFKSNFQFIQKVSILIDLLIF